MAAKGGRQQAARRTGTRQAARDTGRGVEGGLLAITPAGIVGWARDPDRPDQPVRVVLLANDEPLATALADRFDEALVRSRVGPGIGGFVVRLATLPRARFPLLLGLRDQLGAKLGPALTVADAASLAPAVVPPAPAGIEGMIDGLIEGRLAGWAWDRAAADRPLRVELFDGTTPLGSIVADQMREDLREAGKRDGRCGFVFDLPAALLDNRAHALRVLVEGSRLELPGGPVAFGPGAAASLLDEVARLRGELAALRAELATLTDPAGAFQRGVLRTLAERVAATAEIQRDLVERELDALRALARRGG